jgi:hypothetical protein
MIAGFSPIPAQPKYSSGVYSSRSYIWAMTNSAKLLLCALSALVFWMGTHAIATETSGGNPYQAIVDRNVFGLKPPAPPPNPEANKPPPPKITLTGIYTMGGTKRVLMKVQMPAKPPEPAKEVPLTLSEGQREGDVEVLEIDAIARTAKVNNFGTITSLDFTNNGAKIAAGPAPGGAPNPAGAGPGFAPPNPFAPGGASKGIPTARPMRLDPTGASVSPGYGGASPSATYSAVPTAPTYNAPSGITVGGSASGALTLPGVSSAPGTVTRPKNWPPEPTTAEEAAILGAAYAMKNKAAIERGDLPPIPGDNPLLESGSSSAQTTKPVNTNPQLSLPPGAARTFPQ